MTTNIVIADDETLLRSALVALLPMEADICVVAEAVNGAEAVTLTLAERPDVLVIDLEMPVLDGLDAVGQVLKELPSQKILMLTRHARRGVLRQALSMGVQGFASKADDPAQIGLAVLAVHRGDRWISADVCAAAVIDDSPLTERERDVLRETGEGYCVSDISKRLHLAEGTVRNYLSQAINKTQTRTRHDAARYARQRDWL